MSSRPDQTRDEDGFVNRGTEVTRAEAFFDAAFAFAITLMVISIDEIPDTVEKLVAALKSLPAFAASFLLIVLFWSGHAEWSRRYGLNDRYSQRLSLLMVFLVLVFIYPLRMMFGTLFAWISGGWLPAHLDFHGVGDVRVMFVVFALAFGSMGAGMHLFYRHAMAQRDVLGLDAVEQLITRHTAQRWLMLPLYSVLSLGFSALLTETTTSNWLISMPGMIFFVLYITQTAMKWRMRRALRVLKAS